MDKYTVLNMKRVPLAMQQQFKGLAAMAGLTQQDAIVALMFEVVEGRIKLATLAKKART